MCSASDGVSRGYFLDEEGYSGLLLLEVLDGSKKGLAGGAFVLDICLLLYSMHELISIKIRAIIVIL